MSTNTRYISNINHSAMQFRKSTPEIGLLIWKDGSVNNGNVHFSAQITLSSPAFYRANY